MVVPVRKSVPFLSLILTLVTTTLKLSLDLRLPLYFPRLKVFPLLLFLQVSGGPGGEVGGPLVVPVWKLVPFLRDQRPKGMGGAGWVNRMAEN